MAKHMTRRAFVTTACTAVAATALGCSASDDAKATWTWTQDDDLPVLCMQVSGGAIVAMSGSGWKPQDGWIQVQLSGGSIPGKEIESITQEGSTLVVQLKKPASDIETMDLRLTEYRVESGDVSSIESVDIIDKGLAGDWKGCIEAQQKVLRIRNVVKKTPFNAGWNWAMQYGFGRPTVSRMGEKQDWVPYEVKLELDELMREMGYEGLKIERTELDDVMAGVTDFR